MYLFNLLNLSVVCGSLHLYSPLKREYLRQSIANKQKTSTSDCTETGVRAGVSRLPDLPAYTPAEKQAADQQPQ